MDGKVFGMRVNLPEISIDSVVVVVAIDSCFPDLVAGSETRRRHKFTCNEIR